ncbi:hypothetical protein [Rickettsiella endosymbiont of Dermanyssus gallinae]|uniref:hypothetical protein n=1 Tax=Rickettsiella endosymbiont of Dermanyssus gallinae TaxID=2856608 RepID=UPI001C5313F1|nr:hypothetical protein [Rickettsiella endosymbiont of Dermanyssus gallinae]
MAEILREHSDSLDYIANNCKLCVTANITPRDIHVAAADRQAVQRSAKIAKVRLTR